MPAFSQDEPSGASNQLRAQNRGSDEQKDSHNSSENSQHAADPAADAIAVQNAPNERPEQKITEHDRSPVFDITKPAPLTLDLKNQPKMGRITGFDFARDPLNADKPFMTFEEVMKKESAAKPQVMAAQRKLLESRYNLEPKFDPEAKMSRGKPLAVGPTARLASGMTWDELGKLSPRDMRSRGVFPYPS